MKAITRKVPHHAREQQPRPTLNVLESSWLKRSCDKQEVPKHVTEGNLHPAQHVTGCGAAHDMVAAQDASTGAYVRTYVCVSILGTLQEQQH